jgi:hypothetical protein
MDPATARDIAVRVARRRDYLTTLKNDLADLHEQAWKMRRAATEQIIALTEETLARIVADHLPTAAMVVLYEDTSHDAPHGHVLHVLDADGHVLIEGTGDLWHDSAWTDEVDELVFDLHHLDREGFRTETVPAASAHPHEHDHSEGHGEGHPHSHPHSHGDSAPHTHSHPHAATRRLRRIPVLPADPSSDVTADVTLDAATGQGTDQ